MESNPNASLLAYSNTEPTADEQGLPRNDEAVKRIKQLMQIYKTMTAMKLTKTDSVPAEIVDRLYLGSIGVAFNKESLIEHGITHIMTCADNLRPKYPDDFQYLLLPLLDSPGQDITSFFEQATLFITDSLASNPTNKVLVHCFAGKSRSTSFVLAYLMSTPEHRMNLKKGYELVKAKRPIAEPNCGFIAQLKIHERKIFGKNSELNTYITAKVKKDPENEEPLPTTSTEHTEKEELQSEIKEVNDGIQQMKLQGDTDAASQEIEDQLKQEELTQDMNQQ